jgi:Phosphotransferase enzyme family
VDAFGSGELGRALAGAVEWGDFAGIASLISPDAVLDTSSEAGRSLIRGRDAIVEHMSGPGPGKIVHWDAKEWPSGLAATFQWRGGSGVDRRRWYVRAEEGKIVGWWSYAARPKDLAAAEIPERVLASLGSGASRATLDHGGNSGAAIERVDFPDGRTLIGKRVGPAADWLGSVTGDRGRTALLWLDGAFSRIPGPLDHGIEAVVQDGDGWWVLMRDLSATFLGDTRTLTRSESARVLGAAAALHSEFVNEMPNGAAALTDRLGMAGLRIAEEEREGSDLLPKQVEAAWDAFADSVPGDLGSEVLRAVGDTTALAAALEEAGPTTLIHGDLRDDNLGLTDERVVLLDWDLATIGTPTVEFAWYLCHDAWRIDATHDEIEADYREAEGELLTEREVELGMATGLVQYGWIFGHSLRVHPDPAEQEWAQAELDWWVPRTRRALEAIGGMPS